jgi:hypothetical protein
MAGDCPGNVCPVLSLPEFSNQNTELESLVSRGAQGFPKPALELPKDGVILTSPCKDRVDRVMAELRVYNGVKEGELARFGLFDPAILCDMLECLTSKFEIVKCSRDLGYARADTGETSITLLQDGRINMRRMNDMSHVKRLFAMIERAIMPSLVCNCCGMDLLSILADGPKGLTHEHTVFKAGSSLTLNAGQLSVPPSRSAIQSNGGEPFREAVRSLDGLFDWLKSEVGRVLRNAPAKSGDRLDTKKARSLLVDLAGDERMRGCESLAFRAHAILWLVDDGLRGLAQVQRVLEQKSGEELSKLQRLSLLAAKGQMPEYDKERVEPRILLGYAQMRRVDRAMKACNSWTTT